MSRHTKLWTLLAAGLVLFACEREPVDFVETMPVKSLEGPLTFTATIGDAGTRTTLVDGTKIAWNPEEKINIFFGASEGNLFVSTNTEVMESVAFTGELSAFTGTTGDGEPNYFWAVYPYDEESSSTGSSVSARLPVTQFGELGNIPDNTLLMVAKAPGLSLSFRQVCARLKVVVSQPGIERIEVKANNGEILAGLVQITMNGTVPEWSPISGRGTDEIVLRPSGTTFEVGEYYLALLPQTLSGGFTITCYTADKEGSYSTGAVTFERNKFKTVNTGKVTEWTDRTTPFPNEIWYTSSDGNTVEYTVDSYYGNTVLSNTYADGRGTVRFASDLRGVDSYAFAHQTTLTSVTLPEKVQTIDNYAFFQCDNLASVEMGDLVRTINSRAFTYCAFFEIRLSETLRNISFEAFANNPNLVSIHIPETVKTLSYPYYWYLNPFRGCTSLQEFTGKGASADGKCLMWDGNAGDGDLNVLVSVALGSVSGSFRVPDGVTVIGDYALAGATVTAVELNETVQINQGAFLQSTLESVTIPAAITDIGDFAFAECPVLKDMWFESDALPELGEYALGGAEYDEETDFTIHIPGMANITSNPALQWHEDDQWFKYRAEEAKRIEPYQTDDEIWYFWSRSDFLPHSYLNFGTDSNPVYETDYVPGVFYFNDYPRYSASDGSSPSNPEAECICVMKFDGPVTLIPEKAFFNKSDLEWISVPKTVRNVDYQAFYGCSSLQSIRMDNVIGVNSEAFAYCSSLAMASFDNAEVLGVRSFFRNSNLLVAIFPKVEDIMSEAFSGCTRMSVALFPSVVSIQDWAFGYTRSLNTLMLGENFWNPGEVLFYDDEPSMRNTNLAIYFFGEVCPELDPDYEDEEPWSWYSAFSFKKITGSDPVDWPHIKFREIHAKHMYFDRIYPDFVSNGLFDEFGGEGKTEDQFIKWLPDDATLMDNE